MKKLVLLLVILLASVSAVNAQDEKQAETKLSSFVSKTGTVVKFIDFKLPLIPLLYSVAENRVRKVMRGAEYLFVCQITNKGKYGSKTASIEYGDLLEVIKALQSLSREVEQDIASNPDYLENKFTTSDGFQLGYYVSEGKATWYLTLEKYGSDNTIFIKDVDTINSALNAAKTKIEELKTL